MTELVQRQRNKAKKSLSEYSQPCSIERGMRLIGGKWKGSILWHLGQAPMRFNEIARQLPGASKKMIDQRLKEMESQGMVLRKVQSQRPIAVSYELTEFGRSVLCVLEKLKTWMQQYDL